MGIKSILPPETTGMMELNCLLPFASLTWMVNSEFCMKGARKVMVESLVVTGLIDGGAAVCPAGRMERTNGGKGSCSLQK